MRNCCPRLDLGCTTPPHKRLPSHSSTQPRRRSRPHKHRCNLRPQDAVSLRTDPRGRAVETSSQLDSSPLVGKAGTLSGIEAPLHSSTGHEGTLRALHKAGEVRNECSMGGGLKATIEARTRKAVVWTVGGDARLGTEDPSSQKSPSPHDSGETVPGKEQTDPAGHKPEHLAFDCCCTLVLPYRPLHAVQTGVR